MATETLESLSPATIRSVMSQLEAEGFLEQPHTSAGRLPTELGLRLFVDGLLEIGGARGGARPTIASPMPPPRTAVNEVLAALASSHDRILVFGATIGGDNVPAPQVSPGPRREQFRG